jgi:hypothetical protein
MEILAILAIIAGLGLFFWLCWHNPLLGLFIAMFME